MNLFKSKNTTQFTRDSNSRSPLRHGLFLIPLALAWFALAPTAQAQLSPAPDGGYANDNTAEGTDALFSLTTGTDNTAIGFDALFSNTTGDSNTATGSIALSSNTTGIRNTADGFAALNSNTTGERNTATGRAALTFNTIGNNNTADGHDALFNNDSGIRNTAAGSFALFFNTTGNDNAAVGFFALYNNTTGNSNIGLGNFAGNNLTTGNNNIDIGNQGVAGESGTIRIGAVGTQTATFVAGIMGKTVPMSTPVFVNANGQLGTTPSSARFKQEIKPMGKASEALFALKPVAFHYKKEIDPAGTSQFGLVAEDVEKVNPDLVVRDEQGKVYSVRYEAVNAMLLNEFLKEHSMVQELKAATAKQEAKVAKQEAMIAKQQNQIEAFTAGLQKVSAQLEMSRPAPQMVVNHQ